MIEVAAYFLGLSLGAMLGYWTHAIVDVIEREVAPIPRAVARRYR